MQVNSECRLDAVLAMIWSRLVARCDWLSHCRLDESAHSNAPKYMLSAKLGML